MLSRFTIHKQRYNQNEEKKFLNNAKESNVKELKQYQNELKNVYKRNKEEFKKVNFILNIINFIKNILNRKLLRSYHQN